MSRDYGNTDNRGGKLAVHTWQPVDYADGLVRVGVQSAIPHPETGLLLRKLMTDAGLQAPPDGPHARVDLHHRSLRRHSITGQLDRGRVAFGTRFEPGRRPTGPALSYGGHMFVEAPRRKLLRWC